MNSVIVSCPGKVILHGEHSVVYKKPALAAAIGIRTKATLKVIDFKEIIISFPDIRVNLKIDLEKISEFYNGILSCSIRDDEKNLSDVKTFVENLTKHENFTFQGVNALISTIYLLITIALDHKLTNFKNGFLIFLQSDIKIGAGLGSSASFGVCLSGCLLKYVNFIIPIENLDADLKEKTSKYAFLSEKVMHGKPSGVDNTICTYGNIIKFCPGKGMEVINLKNKVPMLLIDTNVSRSTAKLVQNVSELKNDLPNLIEHILNAMEEIVEAAVPVYEAYSKENDDSFKKIERLVRINNNLLRAIEVSHKSLEEIFSIALKFDYSCKLTGAGGGGFAFIVLPQNYKTEERFGKLCTKLKENKFDYFETVLGDDGIKFETD